MSRSMCLNIVRAGGVGYADRIAVENTDPLALLIAEEDAQDGEDANPYPDRSTHLWPTTRSVEEL